MKKNSIILVVILCSFCTKLFASTQMIAPNKQAFIHQLSQYAEKRNAAILQTRQTLLQLKQRAFNGKSVSEKQVHWVDGLAKQYRVSGWQFSNKNDWVNLLRRVDVVPTALLLAQAAIESAWGTSRFARQGNNFFGQWCYQQGCGIVPLRRPKNATYEVRKFPSVYDSVKAYIYNLNSNPSYRDFRLQRSKLRAKKQTLSGYQLAAGLNHYSQRGEAYVGIVRSVIAKYRLNQY